MDSINIERELDRVKAAVFLGTNAAFFGSLMCTLEFVWDESTKTAATDGVHLFFNPDFFLSLTPDQRRYRDWETDRKSTRLNSSHSAKSRMPSSA